MSVFSKQNLRVTIFATIIPFGIWGGMEVKNYYELREKQKLTKEFKESKLANFSPEETEAYKEKLLTEKEKLEAELLATIDKREKAEQLQEKVKAHNKR